jgi:hypothetical protein
MTRHAFDRFQLLVVISATVAVAAAIAGTIATPDIGGFVAAGLGGGIALSGLLLALHARRGLTVAVHDPFAIDFATSDALNFAHVRVAGIGGLGMLIVCAAVTWQFPLTRAAVLLGLAGGGLGGWLLIRHRAARG